MIRIIAVVLALASLPAAATSYDPAGVHRTGETSYDVDRVAFRAALRGAPPGGAILVPWSEGAERGIRLVGVRPGSLYRTLGLRSGDIIVRVGGERPGALSAHELLARDTVDAVVRRQGVWIKLDFTIR